MTTIEVPSEQSLMLTRCGRNIAVSRYARGVLPPGLGRVVLDTGCEPYDRNGVWAELTPAEARELAALLLRQADAVDRPPSRGEGRTEAVAVGGDAYSLTIGRHHLTVDQPVADGGTDTGPSPVELVVAGLVGCVAHYAGRYLDRHRIARDGLRVTADHTMAPGGPARIAAITLGVTVPDLPAERTEALLAVVRHCTVHTTLRHPPEISITLEQERCESPTS
ncbi:OsmC family protein [Kitasatospora sp. NPDC050543]|uniref:OsmC family protein n=1 Tax=Kitasatospora sp. NPDC050543 TaxID=3364054 RepID=UPI0037A83CBC